MKVLLAWTMRIICIASVNTMDSPGTCATCFAKRTESFAMSIPGPSSGYLVFEQVVECQIFFSRTRGVCQTQCCRSPVLNAARVEPTAFGVLFFFCVFITEMVLTHEDYDHTKNQ